MEGGSYVYTMAAKDGSFSFDLEGRYVQIDEFSCIHSELADGRKVFVEFSETRDGTEIVQRFEPEKINPKDMQKTGWQAILNNFIKYANQYE